MMTSLRAQFNIDPKDPKRSQDAHKQAINTRKVRLFIATTRGQR